MTPDEWADKMKAKMAAEEFGFCAAAGWVKSKQAANNASVACDEAVGLKTCHKCGVLTVRSSRVWHCGITLVDYCPECAKKIPCHEKEK